MELNDEILSAYIDGELDGQTRVVVEQKLAADSGARVRLERLRTVDQRLKAEIPLQTQRADDPLARLILSGEPAPRVVPRSTTRRWVVPFAAIAAGIAGLALGLVLASRQETETAFAFLDRASEQTLMETLDRASSGEAVASVNGSARIILTFAANDGRYCRAFQVVDGATHAEGLACREKNEWRVLAWDASAGTGDAFRTAGASEMLDDVMDRLGGGAAFSVDEERALIEGRWKRFGP